MLKTITLTALVLILPATIATGANAAQTAAGCAALSGTTIRFGAETARIVASQFHADGSVVMTPSPVGPPASTATPAHCEVTGITHERQGRFGQAYAIRFHLRLPADWNKRLVFQGGGGSDGELGDALGRVSASRPVALAQGYAVISQDSGHDNATNSDPGHNGPLAFGFDPQARADYGHTSLKVAADAAKAIVRLFYGQAPRYSYFVGCSKGGQEGMTFAQYYPEEFDGIIASAPGFSLPRAALAEAWDTQAISALLPHDGAGHFAVGDLYKTFSQGDLDLVRTAILDACDDGDGLKDGLVGDFLHCGDDKVLPQLQAHVCTGAKAEGCLGAGQVAALVRIMGGVKTTAGQSLYAGWFWPSGIAGFDWRLWTMGSPDGHIPPLNVVLGASSLAAVFTTPPTVLGDPQSMADYQARFDFDRDASKIYAVAMPFVRSAWQDIASRSADLSAFHAHGGKLIVPQGESDPVFSLKDTLAWFDEVDTRNGGKASGFIRVFPVPGMCHCGGGQATDDYDALTPLVNWVEHGQAPDAIMATAGPRSPWPGRQRPLCAYPEVARYTGGDSEKAASFTCRSS